MPTLLIQAVLTVAVFFAGVWGIRLTADRLLASVRNAQHKMIVRLIVRLICVLLGVLGVLSGLSVLGINTSSILTGLGLGGFALTYAFKDVLTNILAGVMIILYEPYRVGELLNIGISPPISGTVQDIDLRYTHLQNEEGSRILVPNSMVLTKWIKIDEPTSTKAAASPKKVASTKAAASPKKVASTKAAASPKKVASTKAAASPKKASSTKKTGRKK